ncbi:MAG: AI-2E family transporter [Acidobacteria bacterium]|nr:AI-2E family transporter [Acidobacteriota bacterium]
MAEGNSERAKPRFMNLFLLASFLGLGYLLCLIFRPFLTGLIWATVLAVVFSPFFEFALRISKGRRSLAAFGTCLVVLLLIVLPMTFLGIVITRQSVGLYQSVQSNIDMLEQRGSARLQEFQQRPWVRRGMELISPWTGSEEVDIRATAERVVANLSQFLLKAGTSVLKGAGGLVFSFFVIFITMFFLLRDGPHILEFITAANPLPSAYAAAVLSRFRDISFATFYGTILTAIVQGAAASLILWTLGISSPAFWGAIVALTSLVPILGTFLVWIPMFAYLLIVGQTTKGILVLVLGGVVVASIDNILKPMIIQGRTDMHPLLVFLSVLGGMQVFGFLGVLLGPLVVTVFLAFLNLYRLESQKE